MLETILKLCKDNIEKLKNQDADECNLLDHELAYNQMQVITALVEDLFKENIKAINETKMHLCAFGPREKCSNCKD